MCGIAGILTRDPLSDAAKPLGAMTDALAHRGPDSQGHWVSGSVALGHRRLSILDLSDSGRQPMIDADRRFVIVFNGEIYNYVELRAQLESRYSFRTSSDTEVLLAAWREWGEAALPRLYGMFAFAIWDTREECLWLAVDRLGVKPIYYADLGDGIVFASEVRGVLASGLVERRLNRDALGDFLGYQTVPAPDTLVAGVQMLLPGHVMRLSQGRSETRCWWNLPAEVKPFPAGQDYPSTVRKVRDLLQAAVARRMIADVPLGAFLSGGIDSSAIVALMAHASTKPVETFSVIFEEKEFDESTWSGIVARKFNTRHHPILLKPTDFLAELEPALAAMDHPSGDGPNSYVVSKATKAAGVTVALSGLGGDELFAGYPFFRQLPRLQRSVVMRLPLAVRRLAAGLARHLPGGRRGAKLADVLSLRGTSLWDILPVYRRVFPEAVARRLLTFAPRTANAATRWLQHHADEIKGLPLLGQISAVEMGCYMQNVLLRDTDQMSMAHALEVREPFLDHDLVEYVIGIPDAFKEPTTPKRLLVDALGDDLPPEVWQRRKMGFTFPWAHWLRHDLRGLCESRLGSLRHREIFHAAEIDHLWHAFVAGDPKVVWLQIWLLVVLEDWMSRNGIQA
jgi:asparagine synthase (glutamine-hydrolysing)